MPISHVDTAVLLRQALSHLHNIDLSPTDVRILSYLSFQDHAVGFNSIEQRTTANKRLIRNGLIRLISLGLVEKPDKRYSRYDITIHGRATLQRISQLLVKQAKKLAEPSVYIPPRKRAS